MGDYHFIYKDVEGSSTEWDDIQRKLGNLPPKPPAFKPDPFSPAEDNDSKPKNPNLIDRKIEDQLEDLEDDQDNDPFYQQFRRQRKRVFEIAKLGSIVQISGSDFVREVSQASSDVYSECGVLMQCLEELATTYPATKFVKIVSTDCIPNYPDRNLPTVLVYNNGAVKANYVGLGTFGRRCTPEGVAMVLCQSDPVLNYGQGGGGGGGGGEGCREAVLEGMSKRIIEKVVTLHENDDGSSSD